MGEYGIVVLRDEEMPVDIMVIDNFICISFRLAQYLVNH